MDRTKKNELKKTRSEKEVVLDLLFSAFQHEQFYSSKNLIEITQQPEVGNGLHSVVSQLSTTTETFLGLFKGNTSRSVCISYQSTS